jgi:protein TonB
MNRELPLYLLGALLIHGAVLWAWARTPTAIIGMQESPAVEIEISEERAPDALPEPAKAEKPAELPPPPPQKPKEPEETVAKTEPEPPPEPLVPDPQQAPIAKPTPRVLTEAPRATPRPQPAASRPPAGPGKDRSHASWKHRVTPSYPPSALLARKAGRVLVTVQVNALGQATAASVTASSGNPVLDAAAVRAARESTYFPKCLLGVPLPDTVAIPYNFDIRSR